MPKDEWRAAKHREIAERIGRLESRVGKLGRGSRDSSASSGWKWLPGVREKMEQVRAYAAQAREAEIALEREEARKRAEARKQSEKQPPKREETPKEKAPKAKRQMPRSGVRAYKPQKLDMTPIESSPISLEEAIALLDDIEFQVDLELAEMMEGVEFDEFGIPRITED